MIAAMACICACTKEDHKGALERLYFLFLGTMYCIVFEKLYIFVAPKLNRNKNLTQIDYEKDS